jgi:hypothetical protein
MSFAQYTFKARNIDITKNKILQFQELSEIESKDYKCVLDDFLLVYSVG